MLGVLLTPFVLQIMFKLTLCWEAMIINAFLLMMSYVYAYRGPILSLDCKLELARAAVSTPHKGCSPQQWLRTLSTGRHQSAPEALGDLREQRRQQVQNELWVQVGQH